MRILWILALLAPLTAWSATTTELGFGGSLDWRRVDWQYQGASGPVTNHVRTLGISLDEPVYRQLRWGFALGLAEGTQTNNLANPGAEFSGQYADVHLRGPLWSSEYLDLMLGASYGYYSMDADENDQAAKLRWNETEGRLGLRFKLGAWRLEGGVYQWRQDGEYTIAGKGGTTTDLNPDWQTGGYAGLSLYTDPTGYVRVEVTRGDLDATTIRFVREF